MKKSLICFYARGYHCFMHRVKFAVTAMVFLMGVLFLSVPAHAGSDHDHHSMESPFHNEPDGKPVHCVLLGHSINNPCPHILNPKSQTQRIAIGPDCGGRPFPSKAISFLSLNKFFLNDESLIQKLLAEGEKYHYLPDLYTTSIIRSIDHPPKV